MSKKNLFQNHFKKWRKIFYTKTVEKFRRRKMKLIMEVIYFEGWMDGCLNWCSRYCAKHLQAFLTQSHL
jgi:hypothetical protein